MKKPKQKAKILAVGEAYSHTGFSRVMHSLLDPLKSRYEFHLLAINHSYDFEYDYPIYGKTIAGDVDGICRLEQLVLSIKPNIVFIAYEPRISGFYTEMLNKYKKELKVIVYCAIEGEFKRYETVERLSNADHIAVFTQAARNALKNSETILCKKNKSFKLPQISIIPHGINTSSFHPLYPGKKGIIKSRNASRKKLFTRKPELLNSFIVFNGNRNIPKKCIDRTIEAFAHFSYSLPEEVYLWLHMEQESGGYDIKGLTEKYGIYERLILTTDCETHPNVDDRYLNLIYNACDVGINTSVAEGWGLVSFEHGATCAAQIVPENIVCKEIWSNSALMVEIDEKEYSPAYLSSKEEVISVKSAIKALESFYKDKKKLYDFSFLAYQNSLKYNWDNIAEKIGSLFDYFSN
ncbi:MAG: hypothetical protein JEY96_02780 [Bacteroidales bacterium]|nr:hypothetical protein [Bacteroidales bacterium]